MDTPYVETLLAFAEITCHIQRGLKYKVRGRCEVLAVIVQARKVVLACSKQCALFPPLVRDFVLRSSGLVEGLQVIPCLNMLWVWADVVDWHAVWVGLNVAVAFHNVWSNG